MVLDVAGEVVHMAGRLSGTSEEAIERDLLPTVNAPGTANTTTFFPAHSLAME